MRGRLAAGACAAACVLISAAGCEQAVAQTSGSGSGSSLPAGAPTGPATPAGLDTKGKIEPSVFPLMNTPGYSSGQAAAGVDEQQPYLFSLKNRPVSDLGSRLKAHGIYLYGFDSLLLSDVTAGGVKHGTFATNWAILGTDIDLGQAAGIEGGSIHFITNDVSGEGHSSLFNGSLWSFQNNWGNHDGFQLRKLTYMQVLDGGKLFLSAGRSNPRGDFDGSELYCAFATIICSSPELFVADGGSPAFTTSSWSARVMYKPTRDTYMKTGIWEDEPYLSSANEHGAWPGKDWGINYSTGAFIPGEAGYKTTFKDDPYPRQYDVGFTYDSATYSDPALNTKMQDRIPHGGTALERRGRTTVYVQAQQMVWKPSYRSQRGVTLFGAANFLGSGDAAIRNDFVAGLFDWGPFKSRPGDYFAAVFQTFLWNHRELRMMDERILKDGMNGQLAGGEKAMEVDYGVNFAPGMTLTPYVEYIWDPDQMSVSRPTTGITHSVQFGAILRMNFNEALALPTMPVDRR